MRILVTNDDGIYAPGLWAVVEAISDTVEVVVAAPDREQSGVGGAITLNNPVRAKEIVPLVKGTRAWAVEGTPADSVILALESLVDNIDLLISGINSGANLGEDVLVSGTVGAALQGHHRSIPSIAISVGSLHPTTFEGAANLLKVLCRQAQEGRVPKDALLNINVPPTISSEIQGVDVTRLAHRTYADTVRIGDDGKGKYFWITRTRPRWQMTEGTDVWSVRHRRISITPLHTDITAHDRIATMTSLSSHLAEGLESIVANLPGNSKTASSPGTGPKPGAGGS